MLVRGRGPPGAIWYSDALSVRCTWSRGRCPPGVMTFAFAAALAFAGFLAFAELRVLPGFLDFGFLDFGCFDDLPRVVFISGQGNQL